MADCCGPVCHYSPNRKTGSSAEQSDLIGSGCKVFELCLAPGINRAPLGDARALSPQDDEVLRRGVRPIEGSRNFEAAHRLSSRGVELLSCTVQFNAVD